MDANAAPATGNSDSLEVPPNWKPLDYFEDQIESGLEDKDLIARGLTIIHDHRLYRENYRSFAAYLKQRWDFCRSRGYQLIHYYHLKQLSTMVDTERQARCLKADGTPRKKEEDDDPIRRAMVYLHKLYDRLNLHDREELIEFVEVVLDELKKQFLEETSGQTAILQNEPTTRGDPEGPLNSGNKVPPAQPEPKPLQA